MELVLHPTAATVIPRTLIEARVSGLKVKTVTKKSRDLTNAQLAELVAAAGLKPLKAHTKAELRAMITSGQQIRPAAYDRANTQRKAKRQAQK